MWLYNVSNRITDFLLNDNVFYTVEIIRALRWISVLFVTVIIYEAYTKMMTTCGLLLIVVRHPPLTNMRHMRLLTALSYKKRLNLALKNLQNTSFEIKNLKKNWEAGYCPLPEWDWGGPSHTTSPPCLDSTAYGARPPSSFWTIRASFILLSVLHR